MRFAPVPVAAALVAAVLSLPSPVLGQPYQPRPTPAPTYSMDILVHGVPRTPHWIGQEAFVEGRLGERYVIRVHNPTWRRVEAVVSVDGRDAIGGQPSNAGDRGYVVAPYSYVDIEGFRLSMSDVAAFRFTTVEDSYASRMGTPWAVGVIQVAVYPERVAPAMRRSAPPSSRAAGAAPSRDGEAQRYRSERSQGLGTEFGESRRSPVVETAFVRENWSWPAARLRVRYDDRQGLCVRGLREYCPVPRYEPPYPPYSYDNGPPRRFAQPPPGWDYER